MHLFTALKLSRDFLSLDPETWNSREDYARDTVALLHVVNDCAEHAVKLATDFNLALTPDEEQRHLFFHVTEHYRKQIPAPLKKNLSDN